MDITRPRPPPCRNLPQSKQQVGDLCLKLGWDINSALRSLQQQI